MEGNVPSTPVYLPCHFQPRDFRKHHWADYLVEGALEQRREELSSVLAPPHCVTFGKSLALSGHSEPSWAGDRNSRVPPHQGLVQVGVWGASSSQGCGNSRPPLFAAESFLLRSRRLLLRHP